MRKTLMAAAIAALSIASQYAHGQPVTAAPWFGATALAKSATGTTAATAVTLPGVAGKTTFLCGFSIRANATAAATSEASVAGLLGGTMSFEQFTAAAASGIGVLEPNLGGVCLPASARDIDIVVTSAAPGSGGKVTVNAWGYQLP